MTLVLILNLFTSRYRKDLILVLVFNRYENCGFIHSSRTAPEKATSIHQTATAHIDIRMIFDGLLSHVERYNTDAENPIRCMILLDTATSKKPKIPTK